MTDDAEYRIARLQLVPGDVLVAKIDRVASAEMIDKVVAQMRAVLPAGVNLLVVDKMLDLSVLSAPGHVADPEAAARQAGA